MSGTLESQSHDAPHESLSETDGPITSYMSSALSSVNDLRTQMQSLARIIQSNDVHNANAIPSDPCISLAQANCQANLLDEDTPRNRISPVCLDNSIPNTSVPTSPLHGILGLNEHVKRQVDDVVALLLSTRRQLFATLQDVQATMTELELSNREYLELECDLLRQSSVPSTNRPILDQTAVFELLERQTTLSSEELERIKMEFENKLQRSTAAVVTLEQQLSECRAAVVTLEQQLSECRASKQQVEHDLDSSNAFAASLERELATVRSDCDRLRQELQQSNDRRTKLHEELQIVKTSKQQVEHDLDSFNETLQQVVNRYIPSKAFPLVQQPLTRIHHTLDTLVKLCPWLFSVVMDENTAPDTVLPNPVSLMLKQSMIVDKLTLERNAAEDKAHRACEEVAEQRKFISVLEERLKQYEQQSVSDQAQIQKQLQKLSRYRKFMSQFLDPDVAASVAANVAAHYNNQSKGSHVDEAFESNASTAGDRSMPVSTSFSVEHNQPSQTMAITPEPVRQVAVNSASSDTRALISPGAVLSRVGSAVTAIAAAITSPRRLSAASYVSATTSSSANDAKAPLLPTASDSLTKKGTRNISHVGDNLMDVPKDIPAHVCPPFVQPSLKRKPLSELPLPIIEDTVRESKVVASQSSEWKPTAKFPTLPGPCQKAVGKQTDMEVASFLHLDPLAESTSGPFRAPHEPAKRPRCEQPTPVTKMETIPPTYAAKELFAKPSTQSTQFRPATSRVQQKHPQTDTDECTVS
ncbi:unnamed protein product [Dicrocoelium dendriticum]|nr:unnamed protein product [Dicrocoelium dendriticum]